MSVRQTQAEAIDRLDAAGCPSPAVDAQILLEHVLCQKRAELHAAPEQPLTETQQDEFERKLARRCKREPLAYIIGVWGFRRLQLRVTPAVLVPRPETELVVERCLAHLSAQRPQRIIDIGTGSGAIAIAIADEHARAHVVATDIAPHALELAADNARRARVEARVSFVHGDLFADQMGPFELVVSNPPYVSAESYPLLEPEVAKFEPRVALVGEGFHERIATQARHRLVSGGWLVMETGEDQAPHVAALLRALGYSDVAVVLDLSERPRIVEGRRGTTWEWAE
ncbi:MAG: peptide chain release factor N(5)-glutamine methyltransferase [Gaiellaceae bacterium]